MTSRTTTLRIARLVIATVAATSAATATAALIEGRTATGQPYLAGGVGLEESEAMRQQAPAFSLQLITAARSGAYLAETHVRIVEQGGGVVLDTVLPGPWLLVDLPTGRYTLLATTNGRTVERRLDISAGKPQRVVLHYDVPGDNESDTARSRMPQ
jgi:hypothetical protein